jgi:hypothetical protein
MCTRLTWCGSFKAPSFKLLFSLASPFLYFVTLRCGSYDELYMLNIVVSISLSYLTPDTPLFAAEPWPSFGAPTIRAPTPQSTAEMRRMSQILALQVLAFQTHIQIPLLDHRREDHNFNGTNRSPLHRINLRPRLPLNRLAIRPIPSH